VDSVGNGVGNGVSFDHPFVALAPQVPPTKTVSEDPNSPPLPTNLPSTETL